MSRLQWLGCIQMQHDKMVVYGSKQLKIHKQNYPTYNLELAAVVFALKIRDIIYIWRFVRFSLIIRVERL